MKKRLRIITLFLVIVMALSVFTSCSLEDGSGNPMSSINDIVLQVKDKAIVVIKDVKDWAVSFFE